MRPKNYLFGLILAVIGCQSHYDGTVLEIDVDAALEVNFEDVTEEVKIIPLQSDVPINQCAEIECFGNETIIRSAGRKTMYYFVDGVLKGTLNAAGRGRGEYNQIQQFVYSPHTKILSVLSMGENKMLKYSVPQMTYLGTYEIGGTVRYLSEHNDTTLLIRKRYPGGGYGIELVSTRDGHTIKNYRDIGGYSLLFDDHVGYYRPNNRILSVVGNISTLSYVDDEGKDEIILAYNFKDKDIPEKYAEFDYENMQELMGFYNFSQGQDIYTGGTHCQKEGNTISFWYHKETVDDKNVRHYICIRNGNIEKQYKGFRVKGLTIPIIPDCIDGNGGFTTIIEAPSENIEDKEVEPSELAKKILTALKGQPDNNPILINYRIQ